jgi:hypothetical protein
MNWLQFTLWITGIYFLYYLVNILIDTTGNARRRTGNAMSRELTFSEPITAHLLEPETESAASKTSAGSASDETRKRKVAREPEVIGSGGVSLKRVFSLARAEAIVYTLPVSF